MSKFNAFMKNQIDTINLHLPRRTLTLRQVEMLQDKGVKLRDGTFQEFDEDELKYIKSKIHPDHFHRVQLPIIITRRRDYGKNAYVVGGDIGNLYLCMDVIEEQKPFDVWKHNVPIDKVFYRQHIRKLRKVLNTTCVLAFA